MAEYTSGPEHSFDIQIDSGMVYNTMRFVIEDGVLFIPTSPGLVFGDGETPECMLEAYPLRRVTKIWRR